MARIEAIAPRYPLIRLAALGTFSPTGAKGRGELTLAK